MRLYFFGKVTNETSQRLLREIETDYGNDLEIFQTVPNLTKRLRQIGAAPDAFVFAPVTPEELSELVEQKELLSGSPIILVLPDRTKKSIHDGHLLMPKFLTFHDNNLAEVANVLSKIEKTGFKHGSLNDSEKAASSV